MFGAIYHIGYLTDDMDRAIEFYEKTFGGELLKRVPAASADDNELGYVKVGDTEVEIIRPPDLGKLGGRTGLVLDHVGYFVPNIDEAMADLSKKGIKYLGEPYVSGMGYRIVYLDPATTMGTRMHLTQKL